MSFNIIQDKDTDFVLVEPTLNCDISLNKDSYHIESNTDFKDICIIPFKTSHLVNTIKDSFKNNDDIKNQFIVDMNRTYKYYKNSTIKTKNLLELLNRKTKTNYINKLMCFTQSALFWPYKILQNKYGCDTIYIGELNYRMYDRLKKKNNIKYYDKCDNHIIISKLLRSFTVDEKSNDKTLRIFNIEMYISFSDDISILKIY